VAVTSVFICLVRLVRRLKEWKFNECVKMPVILVTVTVRSGVLRLVCKGEKVAPRGTSLTVQRQLPRLLRRLLALPRSWRMSAPTRE